MILTIFIFCRELQRVRNQLLELGQDVSSVEATLKITGSNQTENGNKDATQLGSNLTSEKTSSSNPNHINTRNRSRLAQASANDLDEIKKCANVVKDSHFPLGVEQDYPSGSRDDLVGKRRIESKRDDVEQQVPAYQYPQSPTIRSRDAMPPPSLPARLSTPKAAVNAHNGRAIGIPVPTFLPNLDNNRRSMVNPNTPNFHSPSYGTIFSGKKAPFCLTQNHHGSILTTERQQLYPPQVSADQMAPSMMVPQRFGQQSYLTSFHQDQDGVHNIPQESQGHPLRNETVSPLTRVRVGSHINTYGQNLVDSRGVDIARAEVNRSSDPIFAADSVVSQTDGNGGFPKDRTYTFPYYRNVNYQEDLSCTENINEGFFSVIGPERKFRSRKYCTGINDGELDQNITHTSSFTSSTFKTTPIRVSLPPRGSSSIGIGTPRLRTGMSANARSSCNAYIPPTPTTFRPHREPLENTAMSNRYVASPYFSPQNLPRPPQSSPPLVEPSKSLSQARTIFEAPFRIDQRSQAVSNRPMHEHLGGRSGYRAGPYRAGRGDQPSAPNMRRARR